MTEPCVAQGVGAWKGRNDAFPLESARRVRSCPRSPIA